MKKLIGILVVVMFMVSLMSIGSAKAFEQITANEAYDKWIEGAEIIDVRTAAEYFWVGSCAKVIEITLKDDTEIVPDNGKALQYEGYEVYWIDGTLGAKLVKDIEKVTTEAIAYNIPWKMWANGLTESDGKYKAGGIVVKYLFGLIIQEKFPEKTTPLILMCRSGHRSSAAADYLESLGYTEVYEIDNRVKEASDEAAGKEIGKRGGRGGFQGTGYSSVYNGYRGYPNRLPLVGFGIPDPDADSSTREVETVTADLDSDDKDDSVSWSDTGLPISQTFPLDLVWQHLIQ